MAWTQLVHLGNNTPALNVLWFATFVLILDDNDASVEVKPSFAAFWLFWNEARVVSRVATRSVRPCTHTQGASYYEPHFRVI